MGMDLLVRNRIHHHHPSPILQYMACTNYPHMGGLLLLLQKPVKEIENWDFHHLNGDLLFDLVGNYRGIKEWFS